MPTELPDKGYSRIRDVFEHYHDIDVNNKRILRICRRLDIKSIVKYANDGCTSQAASAQDIAVFPPIASVFITKILESFFTTKNRGQMTTVLTYNSELF